MKLTGGCQCGAVRYEISAAPLRAYVCHCRECQRQSASAFGISVIVAADAFAITQGNVRTWRRPADSGRVVDCSFCVECGSRIRHAGPGEAMFAVKGGSLDEPVSLQGASHIWTSRRLPGVVIPEGAPQFAEEPPDA